MSPGQPEPVRRRTCSTPAPRLDRARPASSRCAASRRGSPRRARSTPTRSSGSRRPSSTRRVIEPLTDDELRALLKACARPRAPTPRSLRHRRDEAMIRLMFETGARAGEVVALELADVDLRRRHRHRPTRQGRQGPRRPVRPRGRARPRPLPAPAPRPPARRSRPTCGSGTGARASPTTPCTRPSASAPTPPASIGFHPHQLRHTAAHRWLAAGGSEGGLMAVAGWTRPDMLHALHQGPGVGPRRRARPATLNLGEL